MKTPEISGERPQFNKNFRKGDFLPDGTVKLASNMTGSGRMELMEGTWKLEGEQLTITFKMGENMADIVWDFEYKDDLIHLKRTSPDGSTSVVNSFRRK